MTKLNNIHPGEILLEEFLKPLNISQNKIAHDIGVPPRRINEICLHKRSLTPDTALRLGKYFKIEPNFWLNLQNIYDMEEKINCNYELYSNIKPFNKNRMAG
jgi:addiction module HigA family antidote